MTHLLDTDHVTFLQRQDGREWGLIVGHIARVGEEKVAVFAISLHEQMMGIHNQLNQAKDAAELSRWYERLTTLFEVYHAMNLLGFDAGAAALLDLLRKAVKPKLKPMDLRIAAIALANDLTLVTRNASDFERVPNLKIEDWTR